MYLLTLNLDHDAMIVNTAAAFGVYVKIVVNYGMVNHQAASFVMSSSEIERIIEIIRSYAKKIGQLSFDEI